MEGVSVWLSGRCDNSTVKIEKKTYRSKKNVIILEGIALEQLRGHFKP